MYRVGPDEHYALITIGDYVKRFCQEERKCSEIREPEERKCSEIRELRTQMAKYLTSCGFKVVKLDDSNDDSHDDPDGQSWNQSDESPNRGGTLEKVGRKEKTIVWIKLEIILKF